MSGWSGFKESRRQTETASKVRSLRGNREMGSSSGRLWDQEVLVCFLVGEMTACFADGKDVGVETCWSGVLERQTQAEHPKRREGKGCGHRCSVVEASINSDCLYFPVKVINWL